MPLASRHKTTCFRDCGVRPSCSGHDHIHIHKRRGAHSLIKYCFQLVRVDKLNFALSGNSGEKKKNTKHEQPQERPARWRRERKEREREKEVNTLHCWNTLVKREEEIIYKKKSLWETMFEAEINFIFKNIRACFYFSGDSTKLCTLLTGTLDSRVVVRFRVCDLSRSQIFP